MPIFFCPLRPLSTRVAPQSTPSKAPRCTSGRSAQPLVNMIYYYIIGPAPHAICGAWQAPLCRFCVGAVPWSDPVICLCPSTAVPHNPDETTFFMLQERCWTNVPLAAPIKPLKTARTAKLQRGATRTPGHPYVAKLLPTDFATSHAATGSKALCMVQSSGPGGTGGPGDGVGSGGPGGFGGSGDGGGTV